MFRFKCTFFLVMLLVLVAACGAPAPRAPAAAAPTAVPAAAAATSAPAAAAPEPAPVPEPSQQEAVAQTGGISDVRVSPYQAGRLILKNGEMDLLVQDTDRAIDQITQIAVDVGGYVVSSESQMRDTYKLATLKLGVP
jgi:hypothetical protein